MAANAVDKPATAPARVPRSGAVRELHANVLMSHRAAQTLVATSAAITASDVGEAGAGVNGSPPKPFSEGALPLAHADAYATLAVATESIADANSSGDEPQDRPRPAQVRPSRQQLDSSRVLE